MTEFNLRTIVRATLSETSDADPGVVAEQVLAAIPRARTRDALEQTLRLFVRQIISEQRVSSRPSTPSNVRTIPTTSAKVAAVRDGWQKRLRDRVHVGDGAWKFLGECTYADLLSAAAERRDLAERNAAWARQYDSWARLLTEHDVETFAELPLTVQADVLGRAA